MDAYLCKPIKAETLEAMVARWISSPESREEGSAPTGMETGLLDASLLVGLRELGTDDFHTLIELFLTEGTARIAELRMAEGNHDAPSIARLAHSLKGSSSTFGANELSAHCAELQLRATNGDFTAAVQLILSIDAEFGRVSEPCVPNSVKARRGLITACQSGRLTITTPEDVEESAEAALWEMQLDMLTTANLDGYLSCVNPAWEQTLGYSVAEITSQPYLDRDREQPAGRSPRERSDWNGDDHALRETTNEQRLRRWRLREVFELAKISLARSDTSNMTSVIVACGIRISDLMISAAHLIARTRNGSATWTVGRY